MNNNIIPGKLIFKGLVGSHAYGTNIEGSDRDYKGIYIQSPESVLENGYIQQVQINKDEIYYELKRFIDLCMTANPTVLELLFLPEENILYQHRTFKKFKLFRKRFLTKSCYHSFSGYAYSQIKKAKGLDKKMNQVDVFKEIKTPLDFCYVVDSYYEKSITLKEFLKTKKVDEQDCVLKKLEHMKDVYLLYTDLEFKRVGGLLTKNANELKTQSIPENTYYTTILYFNRQGYSQHCKKYKEYKQWLKKRNTQRYVDVENHDQMIDGKNLLHCVRLLEMGKEISESKGLNVKRPNIGYLISIRKGKVNLETILKKAEHDIKMMKQNFEKSKLPTSVNKKFINTLVRIMRKNIYNEQNN